VYTTDLRKQITWKKDVQKKGCVFSGKILKREKGGITPLKKKKSHLLSHYSKKVRDGLEKTSPSRIVKKIPLTSKCRQGENP